MFHYISNKKPSDSTARYVFPHYTVTELQTLLPKPMLGYLLIRLQTVILPTRTFDIKYLNAKWKFISSIQISLKVSQNKYTNSLYPITIHYLTKVKRAKII